MVFQLRMQWVVCCNCFERNYFAHLVCTVVDQHLRRQINQAQQLVLCAGYIEHYRFYFESPLDRVDCRFERGADPIHFVDKADSWQFKSICLQPNGL